MALFRSICKRLLIIGRYQKCSVQWRTSQSYTHSSLAKSVSYKSAQRAYCTITERSKKKREYDAILVHEELEEALKLKKPFSEKEWNELRILYSTKADIGGFEAYVLGACIPLKNYATGRSLMNLLKHHGKTPNTATIARYLRLCGECYEDAGEKEILNVYSELSKSCEVLDSNSLEHAICALAETSRWRECLDLLDNIRLVCRPGGLSYNKVAAAAFSHKDYDLGWQLLEQLRSEGKLPSGPVLLQWLNECQIHSKLDSGQVIPMLDKLFEFCRAHQLSLPNDVIDSIKYVLQSDPHDWEGGYTTIGLNGVCASCKEYLNSAKISQHDFESMRESFAQKVMEGQNPYLKTSPSELQEFKAFVTSTAPYNVVLDALNIAFFQPSSKSNYIKAKQLYNVVRDLVEVKRQSVLFLGKHHMKSWPKKFMSYISSNAHCFYTNNLSKDDVFLLYAALHSGMGTYIVSRDLMRDHKFCFGDTRLSMLFRRWQFHHQIGFHKNRVTGDIMFMKPVSYDPVVQKTDSSLHVPCSEKKNPTVINEIPSKWLCLRHKGNSLRIFS